MSRAQRDPAERDPRIVEVDGFLMIDCPLTPNAERELLERFYDQREEHDHAQ